MASERGRHLLVLVPVQDWPDAAASFGPATGAVGTGKGKASAAAGVGKEIKP
jgi:hypothetical protein